MGSFARLTTMAVAAAALATISAAAGADPLQDWVDGKVATPTVAYAGEPMELKFSHPAPPASIVPPVWQQSLEWFGKLTGGKVTFKQFGAGTLHGPKDGFKAVRSGISDFATCYSLFEGRGFELTKVFALPFVSSGDALKDARIQAEIGWEFFQPEFDAQGVIYAGSSPIGVSDILAKKPIAKLEDFKGLKAIAQGFPPEAAAALSFVTLNIPYPDIYTSFQQGIVESVIWTDGGFVPYKIYELAKEHTTLGLYSAGIDTCYSKATLDKLPAPLRAPFVGMQQMMSALVTQRIAVDFAAKARGVYDENKVVFHKLAPAELARMKAAVKPMIETWAAEQEAAGKPARKLLALIEELKAKYAPLSNEQVQRLFIEQPLARPTGG